MTYCPIPNERCVEIKYFNRNLFYLKSTARATQNRLACHLVHACHRFASAAIETSSLGFFTRPSAPLRTARSCLCLVAKRLFQRLTYLFCLVNFSLLIL